eukprot:3727702-Pyramimonas_sp.AAC.1
MLCWHKVAATACLVVTVVLPVVEHADGASVLLQAACYFIRFQRPNRCSIRRGIEGDGPRK